MGTTGAMWKWYYKPNVCFYPHYIQKQDV